MLPKLFSGILWPNSFWFSNIILSFFFERTMSENLAWIASAISLLISSLNFSGIILEIYTEITSEALLVICSEIYKRFPSEIVSGAFQKIFQFFLKDFSGVSIKFFSSVNPEIFSGIPHTCVSKNPSKISLVFSSRIALEFHFELSSEFL